MTHLAAVATMSPFVGVVVVNALVMITQTFSNGAHISSAVTFNDLLCALPSACVVELRAFAVLPQCCANVAELSSTEAAGLGQLLSRVWKTGFTHRM
jgi:hypothetical protein